MIKFKPKNDSGFGGSITEVMLRRGEASIANQLNNKNVTLKCELHPDQDSVILVSLNEHQVDFTIQSYCCEIFKPKLEHFLERENTQEKF